MSSWHEGNHQHSGPEHLLLSEWIELKAGCSVFSEMEDFSHIEVHLSLTGKKSCPYRHSHSNLKIKPLFFYSTQFNENIW